MSTKYFKSSYYYFKVQGDRTYVRHQSAKDWRESLHTEASIINSFHGVPVTKEKAETPIKYYTCEGLLWKITPDNEIYVRREHHAEEWHPSIYNSLEAIQDDYSPLKVASLEQETSSVKSKEPVFVYYKKGDLYFKYRPSKLQIRFKDSEWHDIPHLTDYNDLEKVCKFEGEFQETLSESEHGITVQININGKEVTLLSL